MSWLLNICMLGKCKPKSGSSYTYKSLNCTIGKPYKFIGKAPSSGVPPTMYFTLFGQRSSK